MSTISVAILGLGRIGASVGLALKQYNTGKGARHDFQVVGTDRRSSIQADAEKRGALHTTARSLADAARNRDIIIIALPYSDVASAYREIGAAARPGAVVLDMSPLASPSLQWAAAHLAESVYMVSVTPVLNPAVLFDGLDTLEHARADLFDGGGMMLMPSPNAAKDAVELAADFATVLGAAPHFMDAAEHDALIAATEGLPALMGVALFHMLKGTKGWDDGRRMANPAFARVTHRLNDLHPDDLRDLLLNNRANTVHFLDNLIVTLQTLRGLVDSDSRDALEVALIESATAYDEWLNRRRRGRWDDAPDDARSGGSVMSSMMGDYLARRLRRDNHDKD